MVSISKLINNGLLLAGQSVYQDLATPQQSSVEQYNIIRFLGGSGPYIQRSGYGISTDIPDQCTIKQVQLMSRHGERYPSKNSGKKLKTIYGKLKSYNGTFTGSLAFLNDYEYFVPDDSLYEKETSASNSQGLFAGTTDALRHGAAFRAKYGSLYKQNSTLPVFTSNSNRVYQTSEYFARGFLGDEFSDATVHFAIIDEDPKMGVNSLTPRAACDNYNEDVNDGIVNQYSTDYLDEALKRFQSSNPGLNLTSEDVYQLFAYCAYETNVKGASPFCDLFTNEEYIQYSYSVDLSNYYSHGAGHNLTKTIGSTLLNASLTLLKDGTNDNKIWLSFSHDTDLEIFHSALGIVEPAEDLPVDYIPFPSPYIHSQIVPQGARIYTEKYSCGNETYVRYILNDAVVPIPKCSSGPGFSCELSKFEEYINKRLRDVDFVEQCDLKDAPTEVTFYWDYTSVNYSASLING